VHEWLHRLKATNYGGAQKVFGWSFYSQGTHETQTSSGLFFEAALAFFGYAGQPLTDDVARARCLAQLLRQQPCILVLDGVEPLQHPVTMQGGIFKDPGIGSLLRDVRQHGLSPNSLIIITSRQAIVELAGSRGRMYQEIDLKTLSIADGVALLKALGVHKGLKHEYEAAVKAFGGHALALVLLGNLLRELYAGDVNQYLRLPVLEDEQQGGHARNVLRFYDAEYWRPDAPERMFLQLLGLFDRPMGAAELNALLQRADLAQPLQKLPEIEWKRMLAHLRKVGLLLTSPPTQPHPCSLPNWGGMGRGERGEDAPPLRGGVGGGVFDTHPLIRAYFGEQVQRQNPAAWRQAHLVLFEHFQAVPEKEQPDTIEELEPLYRAVHHGCLAGEYWKALDDVYWKRILRGAEYYSVRKLGVFAADLAAIADFFPSGWTKPVASGLTEANQGWLLAQASAWLMSLGRLEEALAPRRPRIQICEKLADWKGAAASAQNLVELLLPLGQLTEAQQAGQQGIAWAGQTDDKFLQIASQTDLAATLHRLGTLAKSRAAFETAENIEKEAYPQYPWLTSIQGTQYCTLLLDCAADVPAWEAVLERGQYMLAESEPNNQLLCVAFHHLTIARALNALQRPAAAQPEFDAAVGGMWKASKIDFMPEVLLARANFCRQQGELDASQRDLDEAWEIITRCGMRLYEAEACLLQGNLGLDQLTSPCPPPKGEFLKEAEAAYQQAKELITEMNYGLRFAELSLLAARAAYYAKDLPGFQNLGGFSPQEHLAAAKARIEEIGQCGLLPEWERVRAEIEQ
jgi:hypothetical protein